MSYPPNLMPISHAVACFFIALVLFALIVWLVVS